MDIYASMREQLTRAAEHLTGAPCKVRFKKCARVDAKAMCFKSGGRAVLDFDLSQHTDAPDLLYSLCHECAHVKLLWHEWRDIPDLPSGSVRFSQAALKLPIAAKIEQEADSLAAVWLRYADANAHRHAQSGDDIFSASLRALANYRDGV